LEKDFTGGALESTLDEFKPARGVFLPLILQWFLKIS
jgi:hypothetical protein